MRGQPRQSPVRCSLPNTTTYTTRKCHDDDDDDDSTGTPKTSFRSELHYPFSVNYYFNVFFAEDDKEYYCIAHFAIRALLSAFKGKFNYLLRSCSRGTKFLFLYMC